VKPSSIEEFGGCEAGSAQSLEPLERVSCNLSPLYAALLCIALGRAYGAVGRMGEGYSEKANCPRRRRGDETTSGRRVAVTGGFAQFGDAIRRHQRWGRIGRGR
jgi:hypothetical protein